MGRRQREHRRRECDSESGAAIAVPVRDAQPRAGAPWILGPALDIPIETAGKRGYRIDQASHLPEAARLAIDDEAWTVRAQVRDALSLYAAQQRIVFLSRKADAQQQIVAMLTKRRSVGENSGPDVDVTVLATTQARADLAAARSAEQDARATSDCVRRAGSRA